MSKKFLPARLFSLNDFWRQFRTNHTLAVRPRCSDVEKKTQLKEPTESHRTLLTATLRSQNRRTGLEGSLIA